MGPQKEVIGHKEMPSNQQEQQYIQCFEIQEERHSCRTGSSETVPFQEGCSSWCMLTYWGHFYWENKGLEACSVSSVHILRWHSVTPVWRENIRQLNRKPVGFAEPQVCGVSCHCCCPSPLNTSISPSFPDAVLSQRRQNGNDFQAALMNKHAV